jgi:hypothetical protein
MSPEQQLGNERPVNPEPVAFVASLAWQFPELLDALRKHLIDNNREIIAHPFMADIRRWAEGLVAEDRSLLKTFLDYLGETYDSAHPSVKNLIEVSFVEQLPYPDEPHAAIRHLLPPNLKDLLWHGLEAEK